MPPIAKGCGDTTEKLGVMKDKSIELVQVDPRD